MQHQKMSSKATIPKTKQVEIIGGEHENNKKKSIIMTLFESQYTLKVERSVSDLIIWISLHKTKVIYGTL